MTPEQREEVLRHLETVAWILAADMKEFNDLAGEQGISDHFKSNWSVNLEGCVVQFRVDGYFKKRSGS